MMVEKTSAVFLSCNTQDREAVEQRFRLITRYAWGCTVGAPDESPPPGSELFHES